MILGSDCQNEGSATEASTNTPPMTSEASPAPQQPANPLTTTVHQQSQPQAVSAFYSILLFNLCQAD